MTDTQKMILSKALNIAIVGLYGLLSSIFGW